MAIAVNTDLILDFLTEAQSIHYVPYTLIVDGLSYMSMFDDDQFNGISFRIVDNSQNEVITRVFIESTQRTLTNYDPFLLSELDDNDLFSMYSNPVFGINTSGADIDMSMSLTDITEVFKISPVIDEMLLEEPIPISSQDIMHLSISDAEIDCFGALNLYDPYLLTDFDIYTLDDMYGTILLEGGL